MEHLEFGSMPTPGGKISSRDADVATAQIIFTIEKYVSLTLLLRSANGSTLLARNGC
jgi:hypothetical protein